MCNKSDNWQCNYCSFKENDKKIFNRNRYFAAHYYTAYFRHINKLCNTCCCNYKACHFALYSTCNNTWQEHISKAYNNCLTGKLSLWNSK